MALTNSLDITVPADTGRRPALGAGDIRLFKKAFVERLGKDHYAPASGNTYDDDDTGEHAKVTFRVGTAPTKADDKIFAYAKDEDSKCELFCIGEDGYETLLSIKSFTFTIEKGSGFDSLSIPIFRAPRGSAIEIIQVEAACVGGTSVTFNIEERASDALNSAGTDIASSDFVADQDGQSVTEFSNAGIAAKACLVFVTGTDAESGTVTLVTGTIYFR